MDHSLEARDGLIDSIRNLEESPELIGVRARIRRMTFTASGRLAVVWEHEPPAADRQRVEGAWARFWPSSGLVEHHVDR
jgi:hypothetical protein